MALQEKLFDKDPFNQYSKWFAARPLQNTSEPYAASLATASADGKVSARIVLVKGFDNRGFLFYTNYNSNKSHDLEENPQCSILFYWPESKQQVRIQGVAEKIADEESSAYFISRPYESQLSAWASEQSSEIPSRDWLEKQYLFYKNRFPASPVQRPPHWGGYRVVPVSFEFWEEGNFRLHDRIRYEKPEGVWKIKRLAP